MIWMFWIIVLSYTYTLLWMWLAEIRRGFLNESPFRKSLAETACGSCDGFVLNQFGADASHSESNIAWLGHTNLWSFREYVATAIIEDSSGTKLIITARLSSWKPPRLTGCGCSKAIFTGAESEPNSKTLYVFDIIKPLFRVPYRKRTPVDLPAKASYCRSKEACRCRKMNSTRTTTERWQMATDDDDDKRYTKGSSPFVS